MKSQLFSSPLNYLPCSLHFIVVAYISLKNCQKMWLLLLAAGISQTRPMKIFNVSMYMYNVWHCIRLSLRIRPFIGLYARFHPLHEDRSYDIFIIQVSMIYIVSNGWIFYWAMTLNPNPTLTRSIICDIYVNR